MYILAPLLSGVFIIIVLILLERRKQQKNIVLLSKLDNKAIIEEQHSQKDKNNDLNIKLIQSGITYKEYTEARLLFGLIGFILWEYFLCFFHS